MKCEDMRKPTNRMNSMAGVSSPHTGQNANRNLLRDDNQRTTGSYTAKTAHQQ